MTDSSASAAEAVEHPGSAGPGRAAVLIPGRGYHTDCPLLFFANEVADNRDAYVEPIHWAPPDLDQSTFREWLHGHEAEAFVCGHTSDALTRVDKQVPDARTVLIGKSLASRAAPVAAERELPAVWFTPLLNNPATVTALRRSTAPFLLVGGTDDATWDGTLARDLTPHVLEIPHADHLLFIPGPLAATLEAHGKALTAVEHFLDTVVWTDPTP
jgi:hypothetical protein